MRERESGSDRAVEIRLIKGREELASGCHLRRRVRVHLPERTVALGDLLAAEQLSRREQVRVRVDPGHAAMLPPGPAEGRRESKRSET